VKYGAKKISRAEHLAMAKGYVVACKRNDKQPSVETLMRSYGLRPAEAEALIAGRL
jgi:hypothetical protein